MKSMNKTATEQVDVLVLNPKNREQLVTAFARWLDRRAEVALHALEIRCAPLRAEDDVAQESRAIVERANVASVAPWRYEAESGHAGVDLALLVYASRVRTGQSEAQAWCRHPRRAR